MSLCPHGVRLEHKRCERCEEIALAENTRTIREHAKYTEKKKAEKVISYTSHENLQWLDVKWSDFCKTTVGRVALVDPSYDQAGVAKLFAGYCIEQYIRDTTIS